MPTEIERERERKGERARFEVYLGTGEYWSTANLTKYEEIEGRFKNVVSLFCTIVLRSSIYQPIAMITMAELFLQRSAIIFHVASCVFTGIAPECFPVPTLMLLAVTNVGLSKRV